MKTFLAGGEESIRAAEETLGFLGGKEESI